MVNLGLRRLAIGATLAAVCAAAIAGCGGAAVDHSQDPAITAAGGGRSPIASIQDDRLWQPDLVHDVGARVRRLAATGASVIRVDMRWDRIATRRPANPRDPADRAYDWGQYDRIVSAARRSGVRLLFTVWGTPAWARDPTVRFDPRYPNESIRPLHPQDLGDFAAAAARRYARQGVHMWEGWNEPNISLFLRPQYVRKGARWVAESPATYSAMQKAFYAGIKSRDRRAQVAGGVTAPAGDRCPACPLDDAPVRVTPVDFIRALNARGLRPPMDFYSHHPYPLSGPRDFNLPNRTYVDLYNLNVLTRALDATYLRRRPLWITEVGFGTRPVPEYRIAFTPGQQAAYISDAYRRLRRNPRVRLFTYFFYQDNPRWSSGLLDVAGHAKPGLAAFEMPLAAATGGPVGVGARVDLVGQVRLAKGATDVTIERRAGSGWVPLAVLATSTDGSYSFTLRPRATTTLRARWSARAHSEHTSQPLTVQVGAA